MSVGKALNWESGDSGSVPGSLAVFCDFKQITSLPACGALR